MKAMALQKKMYRCYYMRYIVYVHLSEKGVVSQIP